MIGVPLRAAPRLTLGLPWSGAGAGRECKRVSPLLVTVVPPTELGLQSMKQPASTGKPVKHQPKVRPEQGWPEHPLDRCSIALALSQKQAQRGRLESSRRFARYAAFQMDRMDKTVRLDPDQPALTDAEARLWLMAWNVAVAAIPLSLLKDRLKEARGRGDTHEASDCHRSIKRVNRRVCELRSRLSTVPQQKGRSREARSGASRSRRTVRSSARSGDSGSDSSGDDPPGEDADRAGGDAKSACLAIDCDESISSRATFCSDACRIRDGRYRAERDALAEEAYLEAAFLEGADADEERRFDFFSRLLERDAFDCPYYVPRRRLGHEWRVAP